MLVVSMVKKGLTTGGVFIFMKTLLLKYRSFAANDGKAWWKRPFCILMTNVFISLYFYFVGRILHSTCFFSSELC